MMPRRPDGVDDSASLYSTACLPTPLASTGLFSAHTAYRMEASWRRLLTR